MRQVIEVARRTQTLKGDQPRFERGREGMEPRPVRGFLDEALECDPARTTLPHYASPDGGPMGAWQPAAAGPSGGQGGGTLIANTCKAEGAPLLTRQGARMVAIERALRGRNKVTFDYLLTLCGTSPATLKRDLEIMRKEHGAPIFYDQVQGRYRLVDAWGGMSEVLQAEMESA